MFSNSALRRMILPLFFEQFLVMLVGIADTFIISFAGEAAVSGVSLINSFNTIFIYIFTALASGGAVVISQYIGRNDLKNAGAASSQLLTASLLLSLPMTALVILFHQPLIVGLFGTVEPDVMSACKTYLRISALSYPALAAYNTGAAVYRSIGKTRTTLFISLGANTINVVGNIIGVFVLKAGVAGVAYPTLISHIFSALVITLLCLRKQIPAHYRPECLFRLNMPLLRRILNIAVPNGVESGVFQLVKVALSSVVALFGTYQIAANGISQSIWSLAALAGVAMGSVFTTVIGQCMGAGNHSEATFYFKKLTKITLIISILWNALILGVTPLILRFYSISPETKALIFQLVLIHNLFNALAFPLADPLGKGLRAAGDVRFPTIVSISTTFSRLVFSLLFGLALNMGVIGIAFAMCLDWCIRAIAFALRFSRGKWKLFKVI